jgi:GT2 family glycosyltransferase
MTNWESSSPITLCIINYNGEKYLEETLKSIYSQEAKSNEIILVDNASQDNSIGIIKEKFPDVKIIQLEKNFGPAAARNKGFKAATNNLILFLDNDISLSPCASIGLEDALKKDTYAAVAVPRVFFAKQRNKMQYDGADSHFLGLMIIQNKVVKRNGSADVTRKLNSLATSCFMVDRNKWGEGKPFDESFFFNYEDHDFGLRTRIKGHDIISVSSAICYHGEGTKGLSRREGGQYSKIRIYCLIRNRWQIILKNYQLRSLILLSPVFLIYEIFQLAGVIKKGWLIEWLKASLWILFNVKQIFHKRHIVQLSRGTPDREILIGGPVPFFNDLPQGRLEKIGKNLLDILTGFYWNKVKGFI